MGLQETLAVEFPTAVPAGLVSVETVMGRYVALNAVTSVTMCSDRTSGMRTVTGEAVVVTMEAADTCRARPQPADVDSGGVSANAKLVTFDRLRHLSLRLTEMRKAWMWVA